MTEVTRVACPGCRSLLRFEPEALDFPANCGACDCRFTAGVYVRVTCPRCLCGSKIRESYRGRRVRCVRCRHDFPADEGIPPGAGGRLLVARMLDTDLPEPPETIQPFLGHARAKAGTGPDGSARSLAEERDRLDLLVGGLKAELELAREDFEADRERLALVVAAARQAVEEAEARAKAAEATLAREASGLNHDDDVEDFRAANRERSALATTIDRLNQAVLSARAGEDEALGRLEVLATRLGDSEARALDERRRSLELGKVVVELKREIESVRTEEAAKAIEVADELATERRRGLDLDRLVEDLRAEIEVVREVVAERSSAHEAELAERTRDLEEMKRGHVADLERVVEDAERREAENERLAEAVDRLLDENQQWNESTDRLLAENRRMSAEVKAARSSRPDDRGPPASAELAAVKAEAARREEALVAEIRRLKEENEAPSAAEDAGEATRQAPRSMPSASGSLLSMSFASPSDVWEPPGSIENGPLVSTEAGSGAGDGSEVDLHRDLAATLLYGDHSVDGESTLPDGR